MPVRDKFPSKYFDGNPFDGLSPHEIYKKLQWGNQPKNTWMIEAPEPLTVLGRLAKLRAAQTRTEQKFRDYTFYAAMGVYSNHMYFVPIVGNGKPVSFAKDFLERAAPIGKISRMDYYSEKGGEPGYYYHDHEPPYPTLLEYGGHYMLAPAHHRGARSYAVGPEGVIG